VKILNKEPQPRRYVLSVTGLPGAHLSIAGEDRKVSAGEGVALAVPPDSVGTFRAFLHARPGTVHGEARLAFTLRPADERENPVTDAVEFHAPRR